MLITQRRTVAAGWMLLAAMLSACSQSGDDAGGRRAQNTTTGGSPDLAVATSSGSATPPSAAASSGDASAAAAPRVRIQTSKGDIIVELNPAKAPKTVANFLRYVDKDFYAGTVFHRVIKDFMIQGGGMDASLRQRQTDAPVQNEADNGLKNVRGSIAMARTNDPHSASSQFFINTVDNSFLNFRSKDAQGWGYCVFGKVVEGMEVVDQIRTVRTGNQRGMGDVPVEAVTIVKVSRVQ